MNLLFSLSTLSLDIFIYSIDSHLFAQFLSLAADEETPKAVRRVSPAIADSDARKVALVIGNKDYKDGPLRSPVNYAQDI